MRKTHFKKALKCFAHTSGLDPDYLRRAYGPRQITPSVDGGRKLLWFISFSGSASVLIGFGFFFAAVVALSSFNGTGRSFGQTAAAAPTERWVASAPCALPSFESVLQLI